MSVFFQVAKIMVKYGKRAVSWVNNNKGRILQWVRDGLAVDAIVARIKDILGID